MLQSTSPLNSPEGTKLHVTLVPCWEMDAIWDVVAPMLKRATDISRGRYTLEDL